MHRPRPTLNLIHPGEHRRRDRQAEHLDGLEVPDGRDATPGVAGRQRAGLTALAQNTPPVKAGSSGKKPSSGTLDQPPPGSHRGAIWRSGLLGPGLRLNEGEGITGIEVPAANVEFGSTT